MRLVASLILLVSLVSAVYIEKQASLCGAGLFDTRLPYALRADWFNGTFWLTDSEGWGIVAPPGEVKVGDHITLPVRRVNRYTPQHGFIVELALDSGDSALLSFAGSRKGAIREGLLKPDELREQAGVGIEDLSWVSVTPESCFYGRAGLARTLVVAGLLSAVVIALRVRRQG